MSNKIESTESEQETTGGLLPKLRFPEFQDAPEWGKKPLGEVLILEYGGSLSEQNRKGGTIPVIGSNGIVGYHNQFLVEGPAIVIGRKGSAGKVNWITSDCYPIDTTFYVKNKSANDFLLLFLMRILENSNLEGLKDSGAVPGLNRNEVYSVKSSFPDITEQQKIADCLSSLDDLIAAQSQKLAALKTHKKGLMQQLFPAEGESLPRLRFPEFQDAPEWEIRQLGELGNNFLNGGTPSTLKPEFWQGKIPWITGADVINQKITVIRRFITEEAVKNSATNIIKKGSLLIVTRTGVGKVAIAPFDLAISQDLTGIYVKREQSIPAYLYGFFGGNSDRLKILNQGTSIAGITRESLIEMKVPLPSILEQQKIADCLSSLDDLIAAQSQKLDALKAHKKGLMQQLFPSLEDVQA